MAPDNRELRAQTLQQLQRQSGFADAGLATHEGNGADTGLGLLPQRQQPLELLIAADQRQVRAQGGKPVGYLTRSEHLEDLERRRIALDAGELVAAVLEEAARQPLRARGNEDGVGFCNRLQAGGKIGSFANNRGVVGDARAQQIANHHDPRGNPDPHAQDLLDPAAVVNAPAELKRRVHGALGIVLAGGRITEIGENPIALIARNHAAECLDDLGRTALIDGENLAQVFWVEPARQVRGFNQIAEQDGEQPALAMHGHRRRSPGNAHRLPAASGTATGRVAAVTARAPAPPAAAAVQPSGWCVL